MYGLIICGNYGNFKGYQPLVRWALNWASWFDPNYIVLPFQGELIWRSSRVKGIHGTALDEHAVHPAPLSIPIYNKKRSFIMAKEIILYNLRDDVKEEDYVKWCEDYKGPLLIGLPGGKRFTLLKMMGGIQGNGQKDIQPNPTSAPYKYIGIMDTTSIEDWNKAHETKAFKEEFFPQWFSKWVADFYVLGGVELYQGGSE